MYKTRLASINLQPHYAILSKRADSTRYKKLAPSLKRSEPWKPPIAGNDNINLVEITLALKFMRHMLCFQQFLYHICPY